MLPLCCLVPLSARELCCAVCREAFSPGDAAVRLPCNHLYHSPCILPWLQQRNLCPLCRHVLPPENSSQQQQGESHRRQQEELKELEGVMYG